MKIEDFARIRRNEQVDKPVVARGKDHSQKHVIIVLLGQQLCASPSSILAASAHSAVEIFPSTKIDWPCGTFIVCLVAASPTVNIVKARSSVRVITLSGRKLLPCPLAEIFPAIIESIYITRTPRWYSCNPVADSKHLG